MVSKRLEDLPPIDPVRLQLRRERVFLLLAGIFLGSLTMLNILGVTRFIKLFSISPEWWMFGQSFEVMLLTHLFTWSYPELIFAVAVGVLPYPVTFLCTDLISEFYGRRRANFVVLVGLVLNFWVIGILWLGGVLPGFEPVDPETGRITAEAHEASIYFQVQTLAFSAVAASMIAYMAAQFCDVYLFHFWKKLTGGKHLWLRNNGSTLISQLIDSVAVILITYSVGGLAGVIAGYQLDSVALILTILILSSYVFKLLVALADTIPIYIFVSVLRRYLRIDPWSADGGGGPPVLIAAPESELRSASKDS
ncbi:MAG: queuosine precursor transporter [Phycisphaeraceae bacterium]|nr:queuosine precursor transporter [Phycisphaeraceae bacterium]